MQTGYRPHFSMTRLSTSRYSSRSLKELEIITPENIRGPSVIGDPTTAPSLWPRGYRAGHTARHGIDDTHMEYRRRETAARRRGPVAHRVVCGRRPRCYRRAPGVGGARHHHASGDTAERRVRPGRAYSRFFGLRA